MAIEPEIAKGIGKFCSRCWINLCRVRHRRNQFLAMHTYFATRVNTMPTQSMQNEFELPKLRELGFDVAAGPGVELRRDTMRLSLDAKAFSSHELPITNHQSRFGALRFPASCDPGWSFQGSCAKLPRCLSGSISKLRSLAISQPAQAGTWSWQRGSSSRTSGGRAVARRSRYAYLSLWLPKPLPATLMLLRGGLS